MLQLQLRAGPTQLSVIVRVTWKTCTSQCYSYSYMQGLHISVLQLQLRAKPSHLSVTVTATRRTSTSQCYSYSYVQDLHIWVLKLQLRAGPADLSVTVTVTCRTSTCNIGELTSASHEEFIFNAQLNGLAVISLVISWLFQKKNERYIYVDLIFPTTSGK